MLEWQELSDEHHVHIRRPFAQMRVHPDWVNTKDDGALRYEARVELIASTGLAYRNTIPTLGEAKAWCEAEYRKLLLAELARLGEE